MRIYELAKQLDVESKVLVAECKKRRLPVKNHMSSLSDKDASKLHEIFEALKRREDESRRQREVVDAARRTERAHKDVLSQRQDEIRQRQVDDTRLMEDARKRREEEGRARTEADAETQRKIQAEQQERALSIAQRAILERKKAVEVAMEAQKEELELLARARQLRAEQEKRSSEEATKRKADAEAQARAETIDPLRAQERMTMKGAEDRSGPAGPRGLKKGKVKPTQVFGVKDIVRKSKKRAGDGPAEPEGAAARGVPGARRVDGGRPGTPVDRKRMQRQFQRSQSIEARSGPRRRYNDVKARVTSVVLRGDVTARKLAEQLDLPAAEIIMRAMQLGQAVTINQLLGEDLIELIASEYGIEVTIIPEGDEFDVEAAILAPDPTESLKPRPPVVTVMGHVDHGKTTLLDAIRKTSVAEGEHGGITQHIGAYQVETSRGPLTFLDTPGHEAFTAMRARGAKVTDIVILVVAADDGLMPQTVEAINHAKAAGVPIVVAVNKIDLPGANQQRIQTDLMKYELVAEELGGETIIVPVSAKKTTNIEKLLEAVALQAELLELRANPERLAIGSVIESHVDPNRGAVATVLVQRGTLRLGDYFVVGDESGRVRAMRDDKGDDIHSAPPSTPVEILGLSGSPAAGEQLIECETEQEAREIALKRQTRRRSRSLLERGQHVTLESFHSALSEGAVKELAVILKADVQGSIEAVRAAVAQLSTDKVTVRIPHAAVGGINESDVQLADATNAVIIGFNVRLEPGARRMADNRGIDIKNYYIIYELIEDIKKAIHGMLDPVFREEIKGTAEVLQLFKVSRIGTIAGCIVREGDISRDCKFRIFRNSVKVHDGELSSLRRVKDDVSTVKKGLECGMSFKNFNDLKEGDIIEGFKMVQEKVLAGV